MERSVYSTVVGRAVYPQQTGEENRTFPFVPACVDSRVDRTVALSVADWHPWFVTSALRPGPRERLLDAGREVTYAHGVGVGVDTILDAAGVARRSLYQHFG